VSTSTARPARRLSARLLLGILLMWVGVFALVLVVHTASKSNPTAPYEQGYHFGVSRGPGLTELNSGCSRLRPTARTTKRWSNRTGTEWVRGCLAGLAKSHPTTTP
jgi:hypothetical protein